jgi:hypothetical protein
VGAGPGLGPQPPGRVHNGPRCSSVYASHAASTEISLTSANLGWTLLASAFWTIAVVADESVFGSTRAVAKEHAMLAAKEAARGGNDETGVVAARSEAQTHPATTTAEELAFRILFLGVRGWLGYRSLALVAIAGRVAVVVLIALLRHAGADRSLEGEELLRSVYA